MERNLYTQVQQNSAIQRGRGNRMELHSTRFPHFGGLWEANIKSMKRILLRVAKSAIMNFEELTTLMAQIEAVLNSRPLSPLFDPTDLNPLTPGHFLRTVQFHPFLNLILLRILCPIIPGGNSFNL
ncbi:integrase catalytic domain-containing protein [Trichonephila clavipes]|nr:integrase catalytic domain-containing protein [Trichonephila clavipes]